MADTILDIAKAFGILPLQVQFSPRFHTYKLMNTALVRVQNIRKLLDKIFSKFNQRQFSNLVTVPVLVTKYWFTI